MGWGQSNIADLTEGTMAACHSEKKRKAGVGGGGRQPHREARLALPTAALKGPRCVCRYFS